MFPLQPIVDNRFVANRIVTTLLETGKLDLNDLARMDFTNAEHEQFAQLIGYSVSGFAGLSYVSNEASNAAFYMADSDISEIEARNKALRIVAREARQHVEALNELFCEESNA